MEDPKRGKDALLIWCQQTTKGFDGVDIKDFGSSWADGLGFCALISAYDRGILAYQLLNKKNKEKNLDIAFQRAEQIGIPRVLTKEDVSRLDENAIAQYVAKFFWLFNKKNNSKGKTNDLSPRRLDSIYLEDLPKKPVKSSNIAALNAKLNLSDVLAGKPSQPKPVEEPPKADQSNTTEISPSQENTTATGENSNSEKPSDIIQPTPDADPEIPTENSPPPKLVHLTKDRPAMKNIQRRKPVRKPGTIRDPESLDNIKTSDDLKVTSNSRVTIGFSDRGTIRHPSEDIPEDISISFISESKEKEKREREKEEEKEKEKEKLVEKEQQKEREQEKEKVPEKEKEKEKKKEKRHKKRIEI